MDLGFVVLCPDRRIGGLKNTLGSIQAHTYDRDALCVVGDDATAVELEEFNSLCPTYRGKNTVTSLINLGVKKCRHDWAFLMFSGSRLPRHIERKLTSFCTSDRDVLFPGVDGKYDFVEGSFNGVVINTKFFEEVGNFPCNVMAKAGLNDFEFAKMLWAIDAMDRGVVFKSIVGMKII
jgi:hypothetical protein